MSPMKRNVLVSIASVLSGAYFAHSLLSTEPEPDHLTHNHGFYYIEDESFGIGDHSLKPEIVGTLDKGGNVVPYVEPVIKSLQSRPIQPPHYYNRYPGVYPGIYPRGYPIPSDRVNEVREPSVLYLMLFGLIVFLIRRSTSK